MAPKHLEDRREAVRQAIEAGSFGDAELDGLCGEFDCSRRTILRDARIIREQVRAAARAERKAELHVLPPAERAAAEAEDGPRDWSTVSRTDGYVWMLGKLEGVIEDPRAIGPAKVGALKCFQGIFDSFHDRREAAGEGAVEELSGEQIIAELRAATKGMPRAMRRRLIEAVGT
jgi:hypothetical protein